MTEGTQDVFYLVNGVPGIEQESVAQALDAMHDSLRLLHPGVQPEMKEVMVV